MSKNEETLMKFLKEFIIDKVGYKPFKNFKDVRNRRKVAEAVGDVLINELEIDVAESEINQMMENIENYPNLEEIRKDQQELKQMENKLDENDEEELNDDNVNDKKEGEVKNEQE